MDETWDQIEAWLERHAPEVRASLAGPASEASIAEAEREMGVELPADLRASLRRHDGQSDAVPLVEGWQLLGVDEMLGEWRTYQADRPGQHELDAFVTPEPGMRTTYWDARWVPVAALGTSDVVCVDLAPVEDGNVGQVIVRWKSGERSVLAMSFAMWLAVFAEDLTSGRYEVDDGGLARRRERRA